MLSGDSRNKMVFEVIKDGACDYLVKPGSMGQFRNLWQHVYRKKLALRNKSKRDDEESDSDDVVAKKIRVQWTRELHQKFTLAVSQLGIDSKKTHII